jgi:hypothetical protein
MRVEGETPTAEKAGWRPPPGLAAVAMFALGTLTAVCAAWVSRAEWDLGAVGLPWGLAVATLGAAALMVVAASFGRGPAFAAVLGWATGVVFWVVRPGEAVIASDALGYAFLVVPTVVLFIAAVVTAPGLREATR